MPRRGGARDGEARRVEVAVTLRRREAEARPRRRRARCRAPSQLRDELERARVHARAARGRQGRPGGAPRVRRPRRGAPAARRARRLPAAYGAALSQRNAAAAADPRRRRRRATRWRPGTEQVARSAAELVAGTRGGARAARPGVRASAPASSAPTARRSRYDGALPTAEALCEARLGRDIERGHDRPARTWTTSRSRSGERDLRAFGSQGEQRTAVLALLLAEADAARRAARPPAGAAARRRALRARRRPPRALLAARRRAVARRSSPRPRQGALPAEPAQRVEVRPGGRGVKPIGDGCAASWRGFAGAAALAAIASALAGRGRRRGRPGGLAGPARPGRHADV